LGLERQNARGNSLVSRRRTPPSVRITLSWPSFPNQAASMRARPFPLSQRDNQAMFPAHGFNVRKDLSDNPLSFSPRTRELLEGYLNARILVSKGDHAIWDFDSVMALTGGWF